MNGIIIDSKVYEAEISPGIGQCLYCDLLPLCREHYSNPKNAKPCELFSPCNKIYFKLSQSLTDKLNGK